MDLQAGLYRRRKLVCEECGQRIAWTTGTRIARWGPAAWRWQGKRVPIRYRAVGGEDAPDGAVVVDVVVDLECFSCGWRATRPVAEVPLAALALSWREMLEYRERATEHTEQQRRAEAP